MKKKSTYMNYFLITILVFSSPSILFSQNYFSETSNNIFDWNEFGQPVRACAFGDYDNDGLTDIILSELHSGRVALMHNEGDGTFKDKASDINATLTEEWKGGVSLGDYDNDGDLDLFIPMGGPEGVTVKFLLLQNDNGTFNDVTEEMGLSNPVIDQYNDWNRSLTAIPVWSDFNRDGLLDIYIGSLAQSKLYINTGSGFNDETNNRKLGVIKGNAGGVSINDFNNDGWPDIYMGIAKLHPMEPPGEPNIFLLNDGNGSFLEVNEIEVKDRGYSWGTEAGDFDNDLNSDILLVNYGDVAPSLLMNQERAHFWKCKNYWSGAEFGGAGAADIDNDGDLDLIFSMWGGSHYLYINNGDGTFTDMTDKSGIIYGNAFPVAFFDHNNDGFLDVLTGSAKIYENNGNSNHWIKIKLEGTVSNFNGIGSRIIAVSDNLRQMREINAGTGVEQDEMIAHFGLGGDTKIDSLIIYWPSGIRQVLTDIDVDQTINVTEELSDFIDLSVGYDLSQGNVLPELINLTPNVLIKNNGTENIPSSNLYTSISEGDYELEQEISSVNSLSSKTVTLPVWCPKDTLTHNLFLEIEAVGDQRKSNNKVTIPLKVTNILDDFEVSLNNWNVEGGWGTSWDISPDAPSGAFVAVSNLYTYNRDSTECILTTKNSFNFSNLDNLSISYFSLHDFKTNSAGYLELSADTGKSWNKIDEISGTYLEFVKRSCSADEYVGEGYENVFLRFRIENAEGEKPYWGIDKIQMDPSFNPTGVDEKSLKNIEYRLYQNYPNPFNPSTKIEYSISSADNVCIKIFDVLGKEIEILVDEFKPVGKYEIQFNSSGLSSGVYFYRILSGTYSETRKMMILK